MKMRRFCFLMILCFGLCVALWLTGCGDNPCEDGEPDTCANIPHTAPNSCMVINEDDFACLCCGEDEACPAPDDESCFQWNENTHTCFEVEC